MRKLLLVVVLALTGSHAHAESQSSKQQRLARALSQMLPASQVQLIQPMIANTLYYDTAAELLAATPPGGVWGYASDTHVMYYHTTGSTWVSLSAPTFSGASTFTGAVYANGGVDRSTAAALAIGATNATSVVITPATTVTGVVYANGGVDRSTGAALAIGATNATSVVITPPTTHSGLVTASGGIVCPSTIDTGTGQALTTATSCGLFVSAAASDAVTTFVLPAASTKAFYCFALGASSLGSTRELDIATPSGSDLIIGTTNAAGATGIATTAGASHGIKNTHATAVRGNSTCLQADGTNTWYMRSLSGTWAAF